jgi:hypothetical protein
MSAEVLDGVIMYLGAYESRSLDELALMLGAAGAAAAAAAAAEC